MESVTAMIDEVGLSGLEGCTIDELWCNLSFRIPSISLNEMFKSYLWNQLLQCTRIIKLYQAPHPIPLPEPMAIFQFPDGTAYWNQYLPNDKYCYVSDGIVKGSCCTYYKRRDITEEVLSLPKDERTLDKIEERYGKDRVVLVGTQSCREKSLVPEYLDPGSQLTDWKYGLLEIVGKSRTNGIFRANITNKYFNNDPRSTFHYVKVLRTMGLVNVQVFTLKPSNGPYQHTHIVFLKRFAPFDVADQNHEQMLCNLLKSSPNQMLPVQTVVEKMGKHYKKTRKNLLQEGCIELVEQQEDDNSTGVKAVRFIKDYDSLELMPLKHVKEIDATEEDDEECTGTLSIVHELPLDVQGFRVIDDSRDKGISMQEFKLNTFQLNPSLCRSIVKSLVNSSVVTTIMLDDTSVRTMKLISTRHLKDSKEVENFVLEYAKHECTSSSTSLSSAIRTGKDVFHEKCKKRKGSGKNETESKKIKLTDQSEHKEESEEVKIQSKQPLMTFVHLRRRNLIMEYMEEKRIDTGTVGIAKFLREKEDKFGKTIDRKTVRRLLNALVANGQLVTQTVNNGDDTTAPMQLYYLPSVTQEEIEDYKSNSVDGFAKSKHDPNSFIFIKKPEKVTVSSSDDEDEFEPDDFKSKHIFVASKFQRIKQFHCYLWILIHGFESIQSGSEPIQSGSKTIQSGPETIQSGPEPIQSIQYMSETIQSGPETIQFGPETIQSGPETIQSGSEPIQFGSETISSILPEAIFPWVKVVEKLPTTTTVRSGTVSYFDILYHMPFSLLNILCKPFLGKTLSMKYSKYFCDPIFSNLPLHMLPGKLQKLISYKNRNNLCLIKLLDWMKEMNLIETSCGYRTRKERLKASIALNYNLSLLDTSTAPPRHSFFLHEARQNFNVITIKLMSLSDIKQYWLTLQDVCTSTPIVISDKTTDLAASDEFPLVLQKIKHKKVSEREKLNEQGFGAGGLPVYHFSHMIKNWMQRFATNTLGLYDMGSGDGFEGSSKATFGFSEKAVRKIYDVSVPAHFGGKGMKRNRVRKVLENAHKIRKKTIDKQRYLLPLTPPVKDVSGASSIGLKERISWHPYEDNFIMLSYISTLVLHKLDHPPTDEYKLLDALHNQFKSSRNKTLSALHRRLVKLLKKCSQAAVAGCTNEIIAELNLLEDVPHTFESILSFVLPKYISHDGHLINILTSKDLLLPLKFDELNDHYQLNQEEEDVSLTENQQLLLNIIIATVSSSLREIDTRAFFNLLEQFPESDIRIALDCLKSKSYVVKNKSPILSQSRGSFMFGVSFNQRFEGIYNKLLFEQLKSTSLSSLTDDVVMDTIILSAGDALFLVNQLFNSQIRPNLNIEPQFPSQLLISGPSVAQSKDEDGDESKTLSKSGVGTFLNIDNDTAELQHGSIVIRPLGNIGHLLDPLDCEETTNTLENDLTTVQMTLENFLMIASSNLHYSTVAMTTVERVYQLIEEGGPTGVTMATLEDILEPDSMLLHQILQDLVNFNLIFLVGTATPLYVSHTHSAKWLIDINNIKSEIHPWADTCHPLLQQYQNGVLLHIISHPGITLSNLLRHFKFILQRVSLDKILQNLLAAGCVQCYTLHETTPNRHTPFNKAVSSFIKSYHSNDSLDSIFFEAVVNVESVWIEQ